MTILISDSVSLILLAKITLLDMLSEHFSLVVTPEVAFESTRRQDLADARYIQSVINANRIEVRSVHRKELTSFQRQWGLGKGESSVLLLAAGDHRLRVQRRVQQVQHPTIVIDDQIAHQRARQNDTNA